MRVLLTASTFPLQLGDGLPRFVFDLGQALSKYSQVSVLAPDAPGAARREKMGDVLVHRFAYFWPRSSQRLAYGSGISGNMRSDLLPWVQTLPYVVNLARATRRLAEEQAVHVVNSHWFLPQGLCAAWVRGRGNPFRHVATLHGGDAHLLRRLPMARPLTRFILNRCDAVIAVSSSVRENLDHAAGRSSGATLQPVGVYVEKFRNALPAPSPFPGGYLLFVGRLIPIKGVDILISALPRVREAHPGLGLVIAGYGPQMATLERTARELGLEDAVHFAGSQAHEEVASWLRGCRAAVLPSIVRADGRSEGMPSVIGEALAAGTRVVATRAGGIPDVIEHGRNGWLARPGDVADLAVQIHSALETSDGALVLQEGQVTADALDWDKVAIRYLEIYETKSRRDETQ